MHNFFSFVRQRLSKNTIMIKNILLPILLFLTISVNAQVFNPVKWSTEVKKVSENEFLLKTTAKIEKGWHLYGTKIDEGGPVPTTFYFDENKELYSLEGDIIEEKGKVFFDKVFNMELKYFSEKTTFIQKVKTYKKAKEITAVVEFMVCDDTKCLPPKEEDLKFIIDKNSNYTSKLNKQDKKNEVIKKTKKNADNSSLGVIFLIAFISGFAALLTPCVFPMIPLTVSFFTKQSKNKATGIKNAIIYGVSIVVIYVLLGTLVTAIFGSDSLNALATNVWFNLFFFFLLVVFAFSFLGAFEITLPSSWANKIDRKADKGGYIGIFFMALALAIVSFSCTGPIVGTLLVEAASKGGIAPIIGMLGFSLAIAIPFALFAMFPGWLNSLPKSGGWLNTVKVVLGFLELAFAFKFLSQADLVLQAHFLEREVFIAIWVAIFGCLALYLFGKIKLPHDGNDTKVSVGRFMLGLTSLIFTIYMLPGMWGAPLNLISAFPPPMEYSESPYGVGYFKKSSSLTTSYNNKLPEGAHLLPPHDILAFNDYKKGLEYAKKVNKPVMLDFTGWACVNCRKMEQNVWVKPKILEILKNKVVLISLYVDDKRPLPKSQIVESKLRKGRELKYIGQKWSEFQTIRFNSNSQPFYVLLNHKEEKLSEPIAYTPDSKEYYNWLVNGIEKFNNTNLIKKPKVDIDF